MSDFQSFGLSPALQPVVVITGRQAAGFLRVAERTLPTVARASGAPGDAMALQQFIGFAKAIQGAALQAGLRRFADGHYFPNPSLYITASLAVGLLSVAGTLGEIVEGTERDAMTAFCVQLQAQLALAGEEWWQAATSGKIVGKA